MLTINSKREYRYVYHDLLLYLKELEQCTGNYDRFNFIESRIIEQKLALRKYAHRSHLVNVMGFMCERRIIKDNGIDGYIELVSIPKVFDTLEDTEDGPGAETFFRDFFYREVRPSMYDCTGQAFTHWYKLFKRNGQFWAYHSVGFDV